MKVPCEELDGRLAATPGLAFLTSHTPPARSPWGSFRDEPQALHLPPKPPGAPCCAEPRTAHRNPAGGCRPLASRGCMVGAFRMGISLEPAAPPARAGSPALRSSAVSPSHPKLLTTLPAPPSTNSYSLSSLSMVRHSDPVTLCSPVPDPVLLLHSAKSYGPEALRPHLPPSSPTSRSLASSLTHIYSQHTLPRGLRTGCSHCLECSSPDIHLSHTSSPSGL